MGEDGMGWDMRGRGVVSGMMFADVWYINISC